MAMFPKIQSPCPYKNDLASVMDGDMCRMCKRQVVDLTAMSDGERVSFLKGCESEVCVSYRLPVRIAMAAAIAAAAAGVPMAAAAADTQTVIEEVVVGGIKDPSKVEFVHHQDAARIAELPVVYEDKAPNPGDTDHRARAQPHDQPVAPPVRSSATPA